MANANLNCDTMDSWNEASTESLLTMLRINPQQMKAFLLSIFVEGADEKDVRRAMQRYGNSGTTMWGKIAPMSPYDAFNAPLTTSCKGLTVNLARQISAPAPGAVATAGTYLFIDKIWCGVNKRTYAEVPTNTVIILPGSWTVSPENKWISTSPQLPTQIPFGKKSQGRLNTGFTSVFGIYNIPAWNTPPVGTPQGLPPYSDLSWSPKNGYLFNPGALVPYISQNQQSSASFSAILILRTARDQPQCSEQLAANFSSGRQITLMGSMYITTNGAGTSASGMGSGALVPDITVPTFTSAMLEAQGASNSQSQVTMVRSNAANDSEGLRWIQGPNVLRQLLPLEYSLVTGGMGGIARNVYNTVIYPSGMTNGALGLNYQVPVISETPDLPASYTTNIANGIYDRQGDGWGQVLWISDKMTNVGGSYIQTQQLPASQCGIAGATGAPINNVYPRNIFSTQFASQKEIINVQLELLNEDAPPEFIVKWSVGFGAGNSGSLGQGCHVYMQILSDDTPAFAYVPFGLGVYGNGQFGNSVASPATSGYGVIPGGMFNTWQTLIDTPIQPNPTNGQFIRQWSWVGAFMALTAMPNAAQEISISVKVPLENSTGVRGPAFVVRVDGVSENQQIVLSNRCNWEVVATAATRAVDNKSGNILRPMVDSRFPDLVRDLFESADAEFFKVFLDEESWQERVYKIMTLTAGSFLDLLKSQTFAKNSQHPIHDRVLQLLQPTKRERENPEIEEKISEIESKVAALEDLENKINAIHQQATNAAEISAQNVAHIDNRLSHQEKIVGASAQFGAKAQFGARAQFGAKGRYEDDEDEDEDENAGGFFGNVWDGVKTAVTHVASNPIAKAYAGRLIDQHLGSGVAGNIAHATIGANQMFVGKDNKWMMCDGSPNGIVGTDAATPGAPWISPTNSFLGLSEEQRKFPTIIAETSVFYKKLTKGAADIYAFPMYRIAQIVGGVTKDSIDAVFKTVRPADIANISQLVNIFPVTAMNGEMLKPQPTNSADVVYLKQASIPYSYKEGKVLSRRASRTGEVLKEVVQEVKTPAIEYMLVLFRYNKTYVVLPSSLFHILARIPTWMCKSKMSPTYSLLHNNPEKAMSARAQELMNNPSEVMEVATAFWKKVFGLERGSSVEEQIRMILKLTNTFMSLPRMSAKNEVDVARVKRLVRSELVGNQEFTKTLTKPVDWKKHFIANAKEMDGPLQPVAHQVIQGNLNNVLDLTRDDENES